MIIEPGQQIGESDRECWIVAKRGGTIIDDISLEYPNQRGFAAFDGPTAEWAFRRSSLIIVAPEPGPAYSLWRRHIDAGRKIVLVATHFDRCADWFGHALRWRGPDTFVLGWLPSAPGGIKQ
jgi:hypothetical protein